MKREDIETRVRLDETIRREVIRIAGVVDQSEAAKHQGEAKLPEGAGAKRRVNVS